MGLTDVAIRNAKPRSKRYKLADGEGLFIFVMPTGSKYWRFRYDYGGKEKALSLGVYPQVSIKEARTKHKDAQSDIEMGIDPSQKRKTQKLLQAVKIEDTFEAIGREWHRLHIGNRTPKYAGQVMKRLEADLFPPLGKRKISEIKTPELLAVLRIIEGRGAIETAHRTKSYASQIFRFAIAIGKTEHDIAANLTGALKIPNRRHFVHLEEKDLPEFLRNLAAYDGDDQTRRALQLILYTLVRTNDIRGAKKNELDFNAKLWEIPAERMKMRQKHIVPLSDQALALFKEQVAAAGNSEFIFPNRNKPTACMSENTMLYAIYRMGYHSRATTHGMRHTGSTILNENNFHPLHVERQLAHADRDKVRATYNHAEYLPQRTLMMQWWADHLDALCMSDKSE